MAHGIFVAIAVTVLWVLLQNLLMHFHPAENRFRAMLLGYLLSLPFVFVAYRWLPPVTIAIRDAMRVEAWGMGLFHAYFFHLLLFFLYGECFYYAERSVTLRLFVELLEKGTQGGTITELQGQYSVHEMIQRRLEVMQDRGFLERQGEIWRLRPKGRALAQIAIAAAQLFKFKGQHERT